MTKKFNKLKVAVGIHGNVVFLEKFPDDDERHINMNDELEDAESNCAFKDAPGIYLATLEYKANQPDYYGNVECYLEVVKIEPPGESEPRGGVSDRFRRNNYFS